MSLTIITIFTIVTSSFFASKSIFTSKNIYSWEKPHISYFWQDCNTTFTLSWDDARIWDVNLAPIDERYGIKHTIFASSYSCYQNRSFWRYSFLLDELFQGYDIQSHNGKHIHLSQYNSKKQEEFIKWGRTGIKDLFGFTPIVFAYPYGDTGGSKYVKEYFTLGRTISDSGTIWPPSQNWALEGVTIPGEGLNDRNLDEMVKILKKIYRTSGYQVFKGYGHTNKLGTKYGVSNFEKYEEAIAKIAQWENVWYTSWGELISYEIEKKNTQISKVNYSNDKIEFELSAPSLDIDLYKVPITVSIQIPSSWKNIFPMIDRKYSSHYSIKDVNKRKVVLLDIVPLNKPQKVIIWRKMPILDHNPPDIKNFKVYTKYYNQNWNLKQNSTQYYTFMRFDVTDELSNIHKVNASVFLNNGDKLLFNNIFNPIFWRNSTYGRVIWNSAEFNNEGKQVKAGDINYIIIDTQDGIGNIRRNLINLRLNSMVESINPANLLPKS